MVFIVVVNGAGDIDVGWSGLLDTVDKWLLEYLLLLLLLLLILIQILFLSTNLVISSFSWLWHDNSSAGSCGAILLLNQGNLNPT